MNKKLLQIIKKIKIIANGGRFLNFNIEAEGKESDGYMTQPGYGHPQPSGQISLDETGQGVNENVSNQIWNKTQLPDYPVGENNKPKGYRGPHNDRETRRMPVQTVENVIPPRGVPR